MQEIRIIYLGCHSKQGQVNVNIQHTITLKHRGKDLSLLLADVETQKSEW